MKYKVGDRVTFDRGRKSGVIFFIPDRSKREPHIPFLIKRDDKLGHKGHHGYGRFKGDGVADKWWVQPKHMEIRSRLIREL